MLDIQKALEELKNKNLDQIQTDTAWSWASRAAASFQNCLQSQGIKKMTCFAIGEEYMHEALEHAALVEGADILSQVKKELVPYQEKAAQDVDQMFAGGPNGQKTDNI
jgi:hypothetical protein